MKIAVLPFMPSEGTPPYLGRQVAGFVGEQLRAGAGADVNTVTYLTQVEGQDGPRIGYVNFTDTWLDRPQLEELFQQSGVDIIMDGRVKREDDLFTVSARFFRKDVQEPVAVEELQFPKAELFNRLLQLIKRLAEQGEIELPPNLAGDTLDLGTDDIDAFLTFWEGFDGFSYLQQSNGRPVVEFDPRVALTAFVKSLELDPDFIAPYEYLIEYCRMIAHFRIGNPEDLFDALKKASEIVPDDYKAHFGMGEVYQATGELTKAADAYEKAVTIREESHRKLAEEGEEDMGYEQDMTALYTRMGMAQFGAGMPVNAERNFRKAMEFEGEERAALDLLSRVLQETNRAHEVPSLWKAEIERDASNAQAHVKYAIALFQADRHDEGQQAFEKALNELEEKELVKRYYAPVLVQKGELDRAMDFFEDCIDVAPNDVQLLAEYAQTLQMAGREFEIPKVLRDILNSNPDQSMRAQTLAWLVELEQPKRAESVESAKKKIEQGDVEGAIRDLRPLRNWLADYWKLWAVLAHAHNLAGQNAEAEEAARRLLELFPNFEPGYIELANALGAMDKQEEAYQLMRFAAANMSSSLPIQLNLALTAKRAGHEDEAKFLAKQIREVVGPNEEIEPVLAEIER